MCDLNRVVINGVRFSGLRRFQAGRKGKCDVSQRWFDPGADILYKRRADMTPDEQRAVPGKWDLTVLVASLKDSQPVHDEYGEYRAQNQGSRYQNRRAADEQEQNQKGGKPQFTPSRYQNHILEVMLTLVTNVLIRALAGTGKTETLVWLLYELMERNVSRGMNVIFLAFNTNIKDALIKKLKGTGIPSKTTHGFCFSNLLEVPRNVNPNKGKNRVVFTRAIVDKLGLPQNESSHKLARQSGYWELVKPVCELAAYIKHWAICPTWDAEKGGWVFTADQVAEIDHLVDYYKMEVADRRVEVVDWACTVIRVGTPNPGEPITQLDYDDMLYYVHVLKVVIPRFDLVLTDESQDFNRAQLLLLQKMAAAGARIVAVGDENQGLYRFRGAAGKAMQWLNTMFQGSERGLEVCQLPINYRCARAIIRWAQQWVPDLEGFREEEGILSSDLSYEECLDHAKNDVNHSYAFLCRTNAPIVITAYKLIAKHKRLHILGRDTFAVPLLNLIEELCGRDPNDKGYVNRISDRKDAAGDVIEEGLLSRLTGHLNRMRIKWEKEENREKLEVLEQHVECLQVICDHAQQDTVEAVRNEIDNLFSEKREPGVINLATIHGAKGLEWNTVYVIRPDLLPHPMVKEFDAEGNVTEEYEQEINCCYVAATRARDNLYYVCNWPFGKGMGSVKFCPMPTRDTWNGQYLDESWGDAYEGREYDRPAPAPVPPPSKRVPAIPQNPSPSP